jgi:hypothetical protein
VNGEGTWMVHLAVNMPARNCSKAPGQRSARLRKQPVSDQY